MSLRGPVTTSTREAEGRVYLFWYKHYDNFEFPRKVPPLCLNALKFRMCYTIARLLTDVKKKKIC